MKLMGHLVVGCSLILLDDYNIALISDGICEYMMNRAV